ncbi:MAG: transposase [Terracidiphilus sp.]|jgi:putative transposase
MRPTREINRSNEFAYFVSTQTAGRRSLFRVERWAKLMLSILNHYEGTGYKLHAYVIMPDHLHLLITPLESVEKSVQLIKGGFSFRAKRELQWNGEIWQPGFTDHRIRDEEDWKRHLEYIRQNPMDARLTEEPVLYEFIGFPSREFPQGLKPAVLGAVVVRAEARTLHPEARTLHSEARTLHPEARTLHPEARTLHSEARTLHSEARTLHSEARFYSSSVDQKV